jgi:mono/diheme cytochrome c family protein
MSRALRLTLWAILALLLLLALAVTATIGWRPVLGPRTRVLTNRTFPATPERLARGEYLVRAVTGCLVCHSENDPDRNLLPKAGTEGAGRNMAFEDVPFVSSANITSDKETGAGSWSDDALARAIREGIGHDGRALFPIMPYGNYHVMSDEDLAAIVVYIRTLPPIRKATPPPATPFPLNRLINTVPEPIDGSVTAPDRSDTVAYGRYLATIASCHDCHTPSDDQGRPLPGLAFAGGQLVRGSKRQVASANLTPDPSGIPYYDADLFVNFMHTGFVGAREVSDAMPWSSYGHMTDDDLRAIFAYLKTLAPVKHRIDNDLEPTDCPVCGKKHGGGSRNVPVAE